MDNLEIADYSNALKPLLSLGDASTSIGDWPDYLALGLQTQHTEELLRLVHNAEKNLKNLVSPVCAQTNKRPRPNHVSKWPNNRVSATENSDDRQSSVEAQVRYIPKPLMASSICMSQLNLPKETTNFR
jgi:hypothetical protein